jgi:hypothetical protein
MPSLDDNFKELQQRLRDGWTLRNTGGDPIWYLVFAPEEMLRVKRRLKIWRSQLNLDGWHLEVLSLASVIADYSASNPLRPLWLSGEQANPDLDDANATLRAALVDSRIVEQQVLAALERLAEQPKGLLLITDIEAIHPYLRIGAIEQRLQGKVPAPIVILYPGRRTGHTLSFLGIYPDDGNYRSDHIGGS